MNDNSETSVTKHDKRIRWLPLYFAITNNQLEIIQELIPNAADVNAKTSCEWTPLHLATMHGRYRIMDLLLTQGADVHARDSDEKTPLHFAVRHNKEVVDLLLTRGADIHARDESNRTPLHLAVEHKEGVELLLYRGADIEDVCRWTPLHLAVYGHSEVVDLLLARGADIRARVERDRIPLHLAEYHKDIDLLLTRGADINAEDGEDKTPLHFAVNGQYEVVNLLLARGADIHARNIFEETPLHGAVNYKNIVELLLARGADIHASDYFRRTPLHLAAKGHHEVVELLLERGADIHVRDRDGNTPLHLAVIKNYSKIDYEGTTRTSILKGGHKKVVKVLIEKGANIHVKNQFGDSPLSWAIQSCDECSQILIPTAVLRDETIKPDCLSTKLSNFWNECQSQVERMRTKLLLEECKISVNQFLREADENKLAGYLSNTGIREALEKAQEDFFIYADSIQEQWNKGRRRRILVSKGIAAMEQLKKLPVEISSKIIIYLNKGDLEKFSKLSPELEI